MRVNPQCVFAEGLRDSAGNLAIEKSRRSWGESHLWAEPHPQSPVIPKRARDDACITLSSLIEKALQDYIPLDFPRGECGGEHSGPHVLALWRVAVMMFRPPGFRTIMWC